MSSDWQYIQDNMGGHDEDGLPNFMSETGFNDDSYDDEEEDYEDMEENDNLEVEFDIGDTVKLNSSDVLLTIKSIDDDILTCRWFDKNDILQSNTFNILEISLVEKIQAKQSVPIIDIDEDEIPF